MQSENKKPENPQAYPTLFYNATTGSPNGHDAGMTLRDYFANSAMQGLISNSEWMKTYGQGEKYLMPSDITAEVAYRYSDAMLKQREL